MIQLESRLPPWRKKGFTVVELLVVIAVASLLLAITVPAVFRSRVASHRLSCLSNLKQLGMATHSFADANHRLPGNDWPPLVEIFKEATGLPKRPSGSPVKLYVCPMDRDVPSGVACVFSYMMNSGSVLGNSTRNFHLNGRNGVNTYELDDPLNWSEVSDGLSQTALFSERRFTFAPNTKDAERLESCQKDPIRCLWYTAGEYKTGQEDLFFEICQQPMQRTTVLPAGLDAHRCLDAVPMVYDHVFTPNTIGCWQKPMPNDQNGLAIAGAAVPPTSFHDGSVNVAFCDGSVRQIANEIDVKVWRALGSRNGGESTH